MCTEAAEMPPTFVSHAADVLAETSDGLSGPQFLKVIVAYSVRWNVPIPHTEYPFTAPNKRTALYESLMAFSQSQRYQIIRELCDHPRMPETNRRACEALKLMLVGRYGHL